MTPKPTKKWAVYVADPLEGKEGRKEMSKPIYALAWFLPDQEVIINKHCFGDCGKIIVGGIALDGGNFMVCRTEECPYLDQQMDSPVGEVNGDPVYVRKLEEKEVRP